jgi:hypothetical protein
MSEGYTSFSTCGEVLNTKYGKNSWFKQTSGYLSIRYHPIEDRILDALRYVELAPTNASTFSYEFSSTVKDIGGTFGSVLDKLVRNTSRKQAQEYDMGDYRDFLISEVEKIDSIGTRLNSAFEGYMVLPFANIKKQASLQWWKAYNNLKHSEMDSIVDGCLSNVVYGMASLAILYCLMGGRSQAEGRLFYLIGFFEPLDKLEPHMFPKTAVSTKGGES